MNEPAELSILTQLLGTEMARMVVALNTLATACAQTGQQVREQAVRIEQMQQAAAAPDETETPAEPNVWTEAATEAAT